MTETFPMQDADGAGVANTIPHTASAAAPPATASAGVNRVVVHLVHGTWPDGPLAAIWRRLKKAVPYAAVDGCALWFQSGHCFRRRLASALAFAGYKVEFRPFLWSGFNSFRERAQAAEDLVGHLACGISEGTQQVIIGHSHGGTVAMLALKLMADGATPNAVPHNGLLYWLQWRHDSTHDAKIDLTEAVQLSAEKVQHGAGDIELVTLATPFLRAETFGSGRFLWSVFGVCWITLFCALAVWTIRQHGETAMAVTVIAASVFAGLAAQAIRRARDFVQVNVIDRQAYYFAGKRMLCIRGMSDEAGMGINLGIIGCNIIRTLLVLFGQRLNKVSLLLVMLAYCALVGVMAYTFLAPDSDFLLRWFYAVAWGAAGLIALLVAASLMQAGLGIELAWAGFGFLTTVESSPDATRHRIEIVTLAATKDTAESMRHAVYLHPECVRTIVDRILLQDDAAGKPY